MARRMAAKVFLALGLGVGIALLLQARADSRREAVTLRGETAKWAASIGQLFVGAVEHSMLEGEGIEVKARIADLKRRVPEVDVRIFDQRGIEVFGPTPPPPTPESIPPPVASLLAQPSPRLVVQGRVYRPVPNEERCRPCHRASTELRGVIELAIEPERFVAMRDRVLARVIAEGFTHVMTAEREDLLDAYFDELTRAAPRVAAVAVYTGGTVPIYGSIPGGSMAQPGVDSTAMASLFAPGSHERFVPGDGGVTALVPLPMQERCVACHSDPLGSVRGVLAVSLRAAAPAAPASQRSEISARASVAAEELESVIDTSLRFIMLSNLGRRIADFLDAVADIEAVRELALYDHAGRLYWTTRHAPAPPMVAEVLATGQPVEQLIGEGLSERVVTIAPLVNDTGCKRCHGTSSRLRGAVQVSVSTAMAAKTSAASMRRRAWFTALSLMGILLVLGSLLHYLVARPVSRISVVADEIGRGNLGVTVERADPAGDEIARLGQRINDMVRGLRAKMHLERLVSRGAAMAAADAGLTGISRTGERGPCTVLFSDIRGFTGYSEAVEPEIVVEMLNRLLRAQAEVVDRHGGDIDKFVGDELMAVFTAPDAAARAVRCALDMLAAVRAALRQDETLTVGIGISTGDVVHGAIGHEERMDFTVIGDVVNTGARLCSAAARGEILVTTAVREAAGAVEGVTFTAAPPLSLKGKREPLPVFQVTALEPGRAAQ